MATKTPATTTHSATKLDLFLAKMGAQNTNGRMIFALDATASRQPTWDQACELQAEMFNEVATVGGLEIQLVFYRGEQCNATKWMTDSRQLGETMRRIECIAGYTQIAKVLAHAHRMHDQSPVAAVVFVGDAMEETLDVLCGRAGELGARGIRVFMFQEGSDEKVEQAFRQITRLTRGAYCRFAPGSAKELGELLRAAAVFAAGGTKALENSKSKEAVKLLEQLKGK
jgi:hypothetical protein